MEDLELKETNPNTRTRALTIAEILRGSEYSLTLFSAEEVAALELFEKNGKPYLTCVCASKLRPAKAEEIVRQLYLRKLIEEYGYPRDRIALEKQVYFGSSVHEKAARRSKSSYVK